MKKVTATVRDDRLEAVVERLVLIGVQGLTVFEVKGFGRSGGHDAVFRGSSYRVEFRPKFVIEWVGDDDRVDAVVRAIVRSGATGKIGDGKIFVTPVEEAVRISTGERGEAAL